MEILCSRWIVAWLCAMLMLSGCGNPYSLRASRPRYEAKETLGSIQFTDPKLYRREALINERRAEVGYIDELLVTSKTQTFEPELIRELQSITALSAAVGLSFDPSAARAEKADREKDGIQQEIDVLKLQLQLDQLKRDAELFRATLAAQQAPSSDSLGSGVAAGGGAQNPPAVSHASAEQLKIAIASLQTTLATTLSTKGEALVKGGASASPSDIFQDRAAYRNLLNSAKNAASLDELHDMEGAALIRLYFSATVLPPTEKYMDTLGMLRMQVIEPEWKSKDLEKSYLNWIGYLNGVTNIAVKSESGQISFADNPALVGLLGSNEFFDLEYFYYGEQKSGMPCPGISFSYDERYAACGRLTLAVSRPYSGLAAPGTESPSLAALFENLTSEDFNYPAEFIKAQSFLAGINDVDVLAQRDATTGKCNPPFSEPAYPTTVMGSANKLSFMQTVQAAFYAYFIAQNLGVMELQARKILVESGISEPRKSRDMDRFAAINKGAMRLIHALIDHAERRGCTIAASDYVMSQVPTRFTDTVIQRDKRVAIYEVGPREQVQQLSTVARAAEAIGLAAAISGQVPGRGLGMDGNIAYSRSATGKADALERAPLVVSFAEARATRDKQGNPAPPPAFGWLMGPRMMLDPQKQKLVLEQRLRPYDLSVDLSIPGWWPYLLLETTTAWAPDWRNSGGREIGSGKEPKRIRVDLGPNSSDYAALTSLLSGNSSVRLASISSLVPDTISACSNNVWLQVIGENIWRATTVIIGGRKFDDTHVSVLPDMNGVLVSIDASQFPVVDSLKKGASVDVTAFTRYGPATKSLRVTHAKQDGSCDRPVPVVAVPKPTPVKPAASPARK